MFTEARNTEESLTWLKIKKINIRKIDRPSGEIR